MRRAILGAGAGTAQCCGNVVAERLAGHHVAGHAVRASPGASADVSVFTDAALAAQSIVIAQAHENGVRAVDARQVVRANVAGCQRQKAAGLNLADVRDKQHTLAVARLGQVAGRHAGAACRCEQGAAVVVTLRRLDGKGQLVPQALQAIPESLEFVGRGQIFRCGSTRGHEDEDTPDIRVNLFHQLDEIVHLIQCGVRHRCVDLQLDAGFASHTGRLQRAFKGVRHAAEGIVPLAGGPVEAEAEALHARAAQSCEIGLEQARRGRGTEGHALPLRSRALDDIVNVASHHRITARQNEHGRRQFHNLVNQSQRFFGTQLSRIRPGLSDGAAVAAGKGAGARQLPEENEGALRVVDDGEGGVRSHGAGIVPASPDLGKPLLSDSRFLSADLCVFDGGPLERVRRTGGGKRSMAGDGGG